MEVYVYEHVTASTPPRDNVPGLEREGWAMLSAACRDLSLVPGVRVTVILHPSRPAVGLPESIQRIDGREPFEQLVREAPRDVDWLVIAPELEDVLGRSTRTLRLLGRNSLGADEGFIALASDKLRAPAELGAPMLAAYSQPSDVPGSGRIVVKPRFGAGCVNTFVGDREDVSAKRDIATDEYVYQEFREGVPASIAAVGCVDGSLVVLPAAWQCLKRIPEGRTERFCYEGGRLPIPPELDARARRLVAPTLRKLHPRGYVGLDVILDPTATGHDDVIVEINARLTTSYIGYSRWLTERTGDPTMPGRLLLGQPVTIPPSDPQRGSVSFTSEGRVEWLAPAGH